MAVQIADRPDAGLLIDDTRVSVLDVLQQLADADRTEAEVARALGLTVAQVAAARAFALANPERVRPVPVGRPADGERSDAAVFRATERLGTFAAWLAKNRLPTEPPAAPKLPSFRDWLSAREAVGNGG